MEEHYRKIAEENPQADNTSNPFLQKPLWVITQAEATHSPGDNEMERHLTVFDLVSVGVGGTIGSGVFVLCGFIAHKYSGPAAPLSFAISGLSACLSGLCYAELSCHIPSAGSSYAYVYASMGELPAVIAAACLTLEYLVSSSAVARSWGDKVVEWLKNEINVDSDGLLVQILEPGYGLSPMSLLVCGGSVILLLKGVKESKEVTNVITFTKVMLVLFMIVGGFFLLQTENFHPIMPMGFSGVLRGATSSFFGYIGYDEVCCFAGEAIDPKVTMPKAVLSTLVIVTILHTLAALALVGMQPYGLISETSGFPSAFEYNGVEWAAQVAAAGEVLTLPVVVLIGLMAQPRLGHALARDGLLPPLFGEVDDRGNITKGGFVAGLIMTIIAFVVPFTYMDDLISSGILVAFCMTDCAVILMRFESPLPTTHNHSSSFYVRKLSLESLLWCYNGLCFAAALILNNFDSYWGLGAASVCGMLLIGIGLLISYNFSKSTVYGGRSRSAGSSNVLDNSAHFHSKDTMEGDGYFKTPCVPLIPLMAVSINWYLIAQLEFFGLVLLAIYLGAAASFYFWYGAKNSVGNLTGWVLDDFPMDVVNSVTGDGVDECILNNTVDDNALLLNKMSLSRRDVDSRVIT